MCFPATGRNHFPAFRGTGGTSGRLYAEVCGKGRTQAGLRVELEAEAEPVSVTGDEILLRFLLENLVDESLRYAQEGKLELKIRKEGEFVRFDL